ncbi:MMPL family transporter [Kribbella sp. NPDC051718]|uniref:MMPL family transporter n=1 Tax=Kribbella sp. NPDC051718 TaxID=3155168 RepID=UPI0034195F2F
MSPATLTSYAEKPANTTTLLGGVSASYTDIRDANSRDLKVIFPVAGGLIAIILALLLRSLLSPLVLMLAVVLTSLSLPSAPTTTS